ncbi:MAG TPA: hypothetical protein VJU84_04130 [Pyrinomonadaceae bacterium]|nr:hypothetical protein [Pyrinomonadaceae bacterium]
MKRLIATRVAATLRKETQAEVEVVGGGLGEFSVDIDSRKVVNTNRLLYPRPGKVVQQIKRALGE